MPHYSSVNWTWFWETIKKLTQQKFFSKEAVKVVLTSKEDVRKFKNSYNIMLETIEHYIRRWEDLEKKQCAKTEEEFCRVLHYTIEQGELYFKHVCAEPEIAYRTIKRGIPTENLIWDNIPKETDY